MNFTYGQIHNADKPTHKLFMRKEYTLSIQTNHNKIESGEYLLSGLQWSLDAEQIGLPFYWFTSVF